MKTAHMTLDEDLLYSVDERARELTTTRSAFIRSVLQKTIDDNQVQRLEEKHRIGYEAFPVSNDEFIAWEEEQDYDATNRN